MEPKHQVTHTHNQSFNLLKKSFKPIHDSKGVGRSRQNVSIVSSHHGAGMRGKEENCVTLLSKSNDTGGCNTNLERKCALC